MSFAPEDQLIMALSRVQVADAAQRTARNLLRRDLDWSYILESAIQHAVAPLLWHGLNQLGAEEGTPSGVPPEVASQLCAFYRGNHARNLRLYRVTGEVVREFGIRGVEVMGLKDLQLAQVVYPHPALRPIGDLDLLIPKQQYAEAAACMAKLGFAPVHGPEIAYTLKYAWGHHFRRAQDNVWVDLQWNVMQMEWDVCGEGNFDFEIERMWRNAERLSINDYSMLVPRPEDMLFHLCMHLEGHRYCELILLCDIAEMLRCYAGALDWSYVVSLARRYRVESSLYYALRSTADLLCAPVPGNVLRDLTPDYFKANLFAPLYENLTYLHASLDELQVCAAPPRELMVEFESESRRQAIVAQHLYRELDALAAAGRDAGAEILLFDGNPSEKIYPDKSLDPFQPFDCFVLKPDLPLLGQALRDCGFRPASTGGLGKTVPVHSRDPLLARNSTPLRIAVATNTDIAGLLTAPAFRQASKAKIARKVLSHKFRHGAAAEGRHVVAVCLHALTREELLVVLAARFAQRRRDRLFNLCSLLEFFRTQSSQLDFGTLEELAERYAVKPQLQEALAAVAPFFAMDLPEYEAFSCRLLQVARHDVERTGRYAAFKRAFLLAFTFLSLRGVAAKCKYAARILNRELRTRAALAELKDVLSALRHKPANPRAFAYWLESSAPLGDSAPQPGTMQFTD